MIRTNKLAAVVALAFILFAAGITAPADTVQYVLSTNPALNPTFGSGSPVLVCNAANRFRLYFDYDNSYAM